MPRTETGNVKYLKMIDDQPVFTTGGVARLCGVAVRTVSKWTDKGLLPAYRIPGSNDRRILGADLLKFIRERNMVVPGELVTLVEGKEEEAEVLLVGVSTESYQTVNRLLGKDHGGKYTVHKFQRGYTFGDYTGRTDNTGVIVFGPEFPRDEAQHCVYALMERYTCVHFRSADNPVVLEGVAAAFYDYALEPMIAYVAKCLEQSKADAA